MQISKDSPGIFLKETGMYVPPSVVCWPGNRTGPFAQLKFAQLVRIGKLLKEAWVSSRVFIWPSYSRYWEDSSYFYTVG